MILLNLILSEVIHIGELKLNNGREIFPSKPHLLSDNENGWYYIYIFNSSRIDYLINIGVSISTKSFMNPQWVCAYLNSTQIEKISQIYYISEVLPSDKIQNEKQILESSKYLVYAHESFNPPPSSQFQKIYKNYYITKSYSPQILEDRSVLHVSPYESPQLFNRFSRGTTQQEKFKVEFDGSLLIPELPLYKYGITGLGQVITIIDSGLDFRSCFFRDLENPPPINFTSYSHRKIIRYDPYADSSDAYHGHGTHASGIAAGYADCQQCGKSSGYDDVSSQCAIGLYNGHAPDAKIYFIDAGYVQRPQDLDAEYDIEDVIGMSRSFGGHIFSCSWGYPPTHNEKVRLMYDEIGYDNPDFIFFFGSGNSRKAYDTYAPANSKNIMGVGGVEKAEAQNKFANINNYVYLELLESKKRTVCDFSDNGNLFIQKTTKEPLGNFVNQKIGEKFILIKNEDECSQFFGKSDVSLFITDSKQIQCEAFTRVPRCLVDNESFAQIHNGSAASLVIDFVSEKNGVTYGIAHFTSMGPSTIGTVKPDILAPGSDIVSASGNTLSNHPPTCSVDGGTRIKSGTSMSTPAVAGVTALLAQYIEEGFYPYGKRSNFASIRSNSQQNFIPTNRSSKVDNQKNKTNNVDHNYYKGINNFPNAQNSNIDTKLDNDKLLVTMPLLKALITNSAGTVKGSTAVPDCSKGFGVVHIANSLLFSDETEKMKEFGLRISSQDFFVTGKEKEEFVSEIKLLENKANSKPLVITLAWLDPPTNGEKEKLSIYADLDLFVECPDGRIIYGNQKPNNVEEAYSATERITIQTPKGGSYKIHITCPKLAKPVKIFPAIVVNGPFNHLNFNINPKFLKFTKVENDKKCPFNKTGHFCQHEVKEIEFNKLTSVSLSYRMPKYFYIYYTGGNIQIQILFTKRYKQKITNIILSMNQVPKFGGEELYFTASPSTTFQISEKMVPKNTYIYITLYELLNNDATMSIEVNEVNIPSPSSSQLISPSTNQSSLLIPSDSISTSFSQVVSLSSTQSILPFPSEPILPFTSYDQLFLPNNTIPLSKSSRFIKEFVIVTLCLVVILLALIIIIFIKCFSEKRNTIMDLDNDSNEKNSTENQALEGLLAQQNDVL